MLEKMLGVSPPLKGEAPDSKLAEGRDLRGTSKSDYKKDFERALAKKLEKNDKKSSDPEKREEATPKEELRADIKEKKSLGGIKKKVTEDDDKIVSNFMASQESKVEIPDSKIENPAEIEVNIPENLKESLEAEVKAAASLLAGLTQIPAEVPKAGIVSEAAKTEVALLKALDSALKPDETIDLGLNPEIALPLDKGLMPSLLEESVQQQVQNLPQEMKQPQAFNLEAELGEAVGFNPDESLRQSSGEMLQKMKNFDVDKNSTSEKSQTFEQNVLSKLQNEQVKSVNQFTEKNFSGESQGDSKQQDTTHLKAELLDANQTSLATGQTHGDFKTQLGMTSVNANQSIAGKLEEHREANINEIMNQAQYLVKKGGGEVTVKLSPEGLGELQLKVIFLDGKLNVEMQTQNKDLKKMVEDSLSELKSGLAAHRLSLEHVKINTVDATNADNNTQSQSNLNQHGQENAREQWRDFQSNMNNQSDKKSSLADSRLQPQVSQQRSSASAATAANALRTYGGTKGATINRVA